MRVTGTRANLVKAFKAKLTKTKVNTHTTTKLPATLSKKRWP
ncbi:hypothetical protein [Secundilactobacillus kimchicus]|nr:hypothetical protein [Secundilactobacillus kimchicus]